MKLTKEQKAELGIEFDGDDVPESEILKAAQAATTKLKTFDGVDVAEIAQLRTKAEAGDKFVGKQREEVTRLARLAELGSEEGELPKVVSQQIAGADFDTLVELETYFQGKVAERFPQTARSSQEDSRPVDNTAGVTTQAATAPKVGLL